MKPWKRLIKSMQKQVVHTCQTCKWFTIRTEKPNPGNWVCRLPRDLTVVDIDFKSKKYRCHAWECADNWKERLDIAPEIKYGYGQP